MSIDRLLVIWGEPAQGNRQVIGHLARAGGEFRFWYDATLTGALARGFKVLPEFPELRGAGVPYTARYLFPLFAERIPPLTRWDAQDMFRQWGVGRPDDQFEVLAKSGGIRATDRIELAEYREADDDLTDPLEFRLAGRRFMADAAPIAVGDSFVLQRERDNVADSQAVLVTKDGRKAGYVPRQYTALVGGLLDRSVPLEARAVRQMIAPDDVGKWVVRVGRAVA